DLPLHNFAQPGEIKMSLFYDPPKPFILLTLFSRRLLWFFGCCLAMLGGAFFLNPALAADCVPVGNLVWELKTDGGSLRDKDNIYTWYDSTGPANNRGNPGSPGAIGAGCTGGILCNTEAYVAAVNAAKVCGYNDWRLPTWEELKSLVNKSYTPTIDPSLFPETQAGYYWTSATGVGSNEQAWSINFQDGNEAPYSKPWGSTYVRLVRGPKAPDKCVTIGNLTWEVKSGRGALRAFDNYYSWYDSSGVNNNRGNPGTQGGLPGCSVVLNCDTQAYVNAANAAKVCGYNDWRLPTWEELKSLVNKSYTPTIDPSLFPETQAGHYWTSATDVGSNEQAWSINFQDGNEAPYSKPWGSTYVRLVRGPKAPDKCVTIGNLTWEVKSGRGALRAFDNYYFWYDPDPATNGGNPGTQGGLGGCHGILNCDTSEYVNALNDPAVALCGYTDWRIPTRVELKSLVNKAYTPTIDQKLFLPDEDRTQSAPYWTATTYPDYSQYAWYINFVNGEESYTGKSEGHFVRAVRNQSAAAPITLSSSSPADALPIGGEDDLTWQLNTLNNGPNAFSGTWVPVKRHTDLHTGAAFRCGLVSDPLALFYVSSTNPITGADEVTYDNCGSAFYRFTFTLPADFAPMCLAGEANVDDQGVAFLNGYQISGRMYNPGCNPTAGPTDPCYAEQNAGHDQTDDAGVPILTWPTRDAFKTCNTGHFKPGVNELVFAIAGDAAYYEPTGLEFTAQVTGTTVGGSGHPLSVTNNGGGTVTSAPTGINCGGLCGAKFTPGTKVTLTAAPAADYAFMGWTGACTGIALTCNVTMDGPKSVTAAFGLQKKTLTVTKAGTGNGWVTTSPAGIDCGSDCTEDFNQGQTVILNAMADLNSTFAGWSGGCSGTASTCLIAMSVAQNVTATFNLKSTPTPT
ncbi:MAG TPA: DUF1566 domain-containing protein, partial [Verrucomicrobiota bacterium]|nr:DUF1566 domain-containing protein [Verrucomicrobiota bacterium]